MGVPGCGHGVRRCRRVGGGLVWGRGWAVMGSYGRVWADVGGCGQVCECIWDEFSEFLPENRVPTSADFNTYPIRIFLIGQTLNLIIHHPFV